MANFLKVISDTEVRIGEVRFSYVNVFSPKPTEGGKEKYSVAILIPKTLTAVVNAINTAVENAKEKGKKEKWGGKVPFNCKTPLRDGDLERPDDPAYAGMWFMNASSTKAPGVRVLEAGAVVDALSDSDFYSGCWGACTINFFPYDTSGNKGIGVGLNNVIKTRDDEHFAGGRSADADFADLC